MKQRELKEIKELIKGGFDLELISFELDIPIEDLKKYRKQLENTTKVVNKIDEENKDNRTEMGKLRTRYQELLLKENKQDIKERKQLTEQEIEKINLVITKVETIINKMKNISRKEKRICANEILLEMKKIEDYQLTIEKSEKLISLIQSKELLNLSTSSKDKIDYKMNQQKRIIIKRLAEAVDCAQYQTEELEELKILEKKITMEMEKNSPILGESVKRKIRNKILKIQHKKAMEDIRNDVPPSIASITENLANGTIDIQKANIIIEEQAKRKAANNPKTRFSLTEEQERKQILIQIIIAIRERVDKYDIKNPEMTVLHLKELCGISIEEATGIIVENLINKKNFESAKNICEKFSTKDEYGKIGSYMMNLKRKIKYAEIGDIVLKGINMDGTDEEERAYFNLLEKGIKLENINLKSVILGKSQDGEKNISLDDIWGEENKKEKTR